MVNAWVLFKIAKQAQGLWNTAAESRNTLAWFKESVFYPPVVITLHEKLQHPQSWPIPLLPIQSLVNIVQHQIQPTKDIPELEGKAVGRCFICRKLQHTTCIQGKQFTVTNAAESISLNFYSIIPRTCLNLIRNK